MSFSARIAAQTALVYDLRVSLDGEARYFIIQVPPAKRAAFVAAIAADTGFTLEDYGTILHRGWDAPQLSLKRDLRAQFGMYANDDLETPIDEGC
jgi:hypothetical protein